MTPKIVLASIVINEMEWLPALYQQHKEWLGMVKWVFVEMADKVYAETNPDMVSSRGLSVDGTTEYLEALAKHDERVVHIKHGLSTHPYPEQGKCQAKNRFLREADKVRPDFIIIADGDEFYTRQHQSQLTWALMEHRADGTILTRREIWRPPSIQDQPLFKLEVVGGFWAIPCCHWWRWYPGLQYDINHNTPSLNGHLMTTRRVKKLMGPDDPQMIHMGFASSLKVREAKHKYYAARGEGVTDRRGWYVSSRASWESWHPGVRLPRGARVIPYTGPKPEVFQ